MRAFVAKKLRRGDLEARGFRTKPEVGKAQEIIPPFFFDHAKITWELNTVEKFGICFEAVEVRRPKRTNPAVNQEAAGSERPAPKGDEQTIEKKKGRPTAEDAIMSAIASLTKQGVNFQAYPRKKSYEAIRVYLQKAHYDISRNFSDPVLNRCLIRYLDQK